MATKYKDLDNDPIYLKVNLRRARKIIKDILDNEEYIAMLKRRAIAGVLAPAMEMMLWHYYFGKPQENVNVSVKAVGEDLTKLTDEQLAERMTKAADILSAKVEFQDGPYKN